MIAVFIEVQGEQIPETAFPDDEPGVLHDGPEPEKDVFSFRVNGRCWKSHDGLKISYREPEEANVGNTDTTITILPNGTVSVNRVGYLNAGMIFEEGVPHVCVYDAGFLQLQITLRTHQLIHSVSEAGGCIDIDYSIEVGGRAEGRNRLKILITPAIPPVVRNESRPDSAPKSRSARV
ncbi:MAG: DUF1934 domain-containing protein [Clostridia bacterium]|nr:DUF1934 domain-containing protein [Clostridia bacterium]